MATEHKFFLDFKKLERDVQPDLILWIYFWDNNTRVIKNHSFVNTLAQMYFQKTPVKASLKHVWDKYHYLLNDVFAGKFKCARIYSANNKGPEDYVVEYTASGEVTYKSKGKIIQHVPFNWNGSGLAKFERQAENDMELFLAQIRSKYAK